MIEDNLRQNARKSILRVAVPIAPSKAAQRAGPFSWASGADRRAQFYLIPSNQQNDDLACSLASIEYRSLDGAFLI